MLNTQEIYFATVIASVFVGLLVAIIVVTLYLYYKRRRAHQLALYAFDNVLLQTRLEIQEQTFLTISQELHDNLGQLLALAKLQLKTLNLDKPEPAKEKLADATQLITQTIQGLRDLSRTLNTDTIAALGLLKALETELALIEKTGVVKTVFRVDGDMPVMDNRKSLILFRIVQEGLHNVLKHSQATIAEVHVQVTPSHLLLRITDNGKGLGENGVAAQHSDDLQRFTHGSGLRNMAGRAKIIGAEFQLHSAPNQGTTIALEMPLL